MSAADSISWWSIVPAWAGLLISAVVLVRQVRKDRPRVKVATTNGFITYTNGGLSDPMLFLEAANAGTVTVWLQPPRFRLPGGKTIQVMRTYNQFPHQLDPGKSVKEWIEMSVTVQQLRVLGFEGRVRLVAEYRDAVDRIYSAKAFPLDLDGWSSAA